MQVNYLSAFESIEAVLPHFTEQRSGHIVLVSSIIGKKAMPNTAGYCATKFAQVGLGEALWGELKDKGIGVSVICPGYTATEFHGVATAKSSKVNRPVKGQDSVVVAKAIVRAFTKQKKEIHLSWAGKLLLSIDRISNTLGNQAVLLAAKFNQKPEDSSK